MPQVSISFRFSQRFNSPAREVYEWATDYDPEDFVRMGHSPYLPFRFAKPRQAFFVQLPRFVVLALKLSGVPLVIERPANSGKIIRVAEPRQADLQECFG